MCEGVKRLFLFINFIILFILLFLFILLILFSQRGLFLNDALCDGVAHLGALHKGVEGLDVFGQTGAAVRHVTVGAGHLGVLRMNPFVAVVQHQGAHDVKVGARDLLAQQVHFGKELHFGGVKGVAAQFDQTGLFGPHHRDGGVGKNVAEKQTQRARVRLGPFGVAENNVALARKVGMGRFGAQELGVVEYFQLWIHRVDHATIIGQNGGFNNNSAGIAQLVQVVNGFVERTHVVRARLGVKGRRQANKNHGAGQEVA